VTGTLQKAIDRINVVPSGMKVPDFMIHTGDITQNSKAAEFDTAVQVIRSAKVQEVFYVPGEHDFPSTTARYISSASAKARRAADGTATTTGACTLLVSTTACRWTRWGTSAKNSWHG
jgi:3',5'-cyclic AMP phosphodiesterase CpdA